MTGTAFPPEQAVNGQTVTLESIFNEVGIRLQVDEDETTIAPLSIPEDDCISDAELTTLENGHRQLSLFPTSLCPFLFCNTYHLYGIVVNHYGEVLDACSPGFILGKIWQTHTRSAFAIFYKVNSIQTDGAGYLRTTAHEIGHTFNLHHSDGDGTTIMTQTDDVAENWVYQFSAQSQDHLQNHPAQCKFPGAIGGAPFLWVTEEHAAWPHVEELTTTNCN